MTEEESKIVEKSEQILKKLTLVYYLIVSLPLPFMMIVMLDNYHFSDEFQQVVFDQEMYTLLATMVVAGFVMWYLFKQYKLKLAVIRGGNSILRAIDAYQKENIKLYLLMGACAYPFFFLYLKSALLMYVGMFCFLEFIIMALERPSSKRLVRNLRIKKPLSDRIKGVPEPKESSSD